MQLYYKICGERYGTNIYIHIMCSCVTHTYPAKLPSKVHSISVSGYSADHGKSHHDFPTEPSCHSSRRGDVYLLVMVTRSASEPIIWGNLCRIVSSPIQNQQTTQPVN